MSRLIALGALLVPLAGLTACTEQAEATWKDGLEQELRRVDEASTWVKGWNSRARSASDIPDPLSVTENSKPTRRSEMRVPRTR